MSEKKGLFMEYIEGLVYALLLALIGGALIYAILVSFMNEQWLMGFLFIALTLLMTTKFDWRRLKRITHFLNCKQNLTKANGMLSRKNTESGEMR